MEDILVPIFICVVLPVAIVLIVSLTKMNADNQRAKILLKAIESNNEIDADKLAESLKKPVRTAEEVLNLRLLRGCLFSLIGIALYVVSCVTYDNSYIQGVDFESDQVYIPFIFGCASLAVGISYLTVYFVTRKQSKKD